MAEDQGTELHHVTFGEAVKLARSKPERGRERSDLIVRDNVLEPHWHWSREVGIPRDEAVERARRVFLEDVMLVGKEEKVKEKKQKIERGKDAEPEAVLQQAPASPAPLITPETVYSVPEEEGESSVGAVVKRLPFAEVFVATISVVLYFFVAYTTMELLIILVANLALTLASVAGWLFLGSRKSGQGQSVVPTAPETKP